MTLPTTTNPLAPPPLTGQRALDVWLRDLYQKLGKATIEAPIKATNITGVLASANAAANLAKNTTNDATIDSIDAGATATVRIYGPGGVGSNWNRYRNGVLVGTHPAATFTGKAYTTRFYVGFDVILSSFIISNSFKDVTKDDMNVLSVLTVAAGGGGGSSGGGGAGAGGEGGVGSQGGAYGLLI